MTICSLTITDNVFKRIAELAAKEGSKPILRIAVDGGGCSGFRYRYEMVNVTAEDDLIIEKDGQSVVIDRISQEFMNDCAVNYIEELGSSYFEIKNPKATSKCGCGSSFSI